jgi:OFA family oxalate/formate antiporter-like MFS transporter
MDLMKKRWVVLIASVVVNICIGTGFAWSVYQTGLFNEAKTIFGMDVQKAQLALAFTICSGVAPIPMIAGSGLQKKLKGPRNVIWVGGILFALGLILTSMVSNLSSLYLTYGLLSGFGIAFAYGITIGNTVKFFPDKRGLIAGISTAAYGAGSIIFPPIMQSMIASKGVMYTFRTLGILYGIVILIAACFVSEPPAGWKPDGWEPKQPANGSAKAIVDKNWKEMLCDGKFYLMIIAFTIYATGGLMVVSQGLPMAQAIGGVSIGTAAAAVSIIAIANTLGRVIWGTISDKIGRYPALICMSVIILVSGFALSALTKSGSYAVFLIFAMLIAMCYGGSMGVYPALTADAFGMKNNGVNYGVMFIGFALGGYIGPVVANKLFDSTGSYASPLLVVGILGIVALVINLMLTAMKKKAVN